MIDVSLSLALERTPPLHVPPTIQTACASVVMALHRRTPGMTSVGVTSAQAKEGRSTIAAGLAIAQAMTMGQRTVLVDLDPEPADPASAPSAAAETGTLDAADAIEWVVDDLGVLSARPWLSPNGTLTRRAASDIVDQLRRLDVTVVADLPAALPTGAAGRYADLFDTVVLVVRAGSTPADLVKRASDALPEPPLVVLNGASSAIPRWLRGGGKH